MSAIDQQTKRAKKWILYVLKCRDNTWYTGITNDLARRVQEHNDGLASRYTRSRLPVTVIYQEPCGGRSSALRKEYAIKQLSRKEKADYITSHSDTNTAGLSGRRRDFRGPGKKVQKKSYD